MLQFVEQKYLSVKTSCAFVLKGHFSVNLLNFGYLNCETEQRPWEKNVLADNSSG